MCHCGSNNFFNPFMDKIPTEVLTLKKYLRVLINSKSGPYHENWPGIYWIKVTFEFIPMPFSIEYIRKSFTNKYSTYNMYNLLNSKLDESLDGLLIYKSLVIIKNKDLFDQIIRTIDYVIIYIK